MKGHRIVEGIKADIEGSSKELTELCSKLVQFPTVVPPGYTRECVEFIEAYFRSLGLETEVHERRKDKTNLCVKVPGKRKGKILWLGHLDVVPEGSEPWKYPPFSGKVMEGLVYGRGSSDMKGACASAMVAAKVLASLEESERSSVEFWFTCDEEVGAVDGARWLAESGRLKGDLCIIGDSSGGMPSEPSMDLGCKGALRVTLKARGRTAHGSQPYLGDNAIDKLIDAIGYVKEIGSFRLDVPEELEPVLKTSVEFLLRHYKLTESQKADVTKVFHYPSVSLNIIRGGVKINVVPDAAEALFDIRITPGADIEAVKGRILELLKASGLEGIDAEFEVTGFGGYYEKPDLVYVDSLKRAVELATGRTPILKIITGGTDGIFTRKIAGIPSLGFGAGLPGMAHAKDEYVTVESMVMAAKVYAIYPVIFDVP
ncbi:MAG: ArgE/DapE family deacylase [Candidatus Bathyarchaeia archaeon]